MSPSRAVRRLNVTGFALNGRLALTATTGADSDELTICRFVTQGTADARPRGQRCAVTSGSAAPEGGVMMSMAIRRARRVSTTPDLRLSRPFRLQSDDVATLWWDSARVAVLRPGR
jgi:hypothetical protein